MKTAQNAIEPSSGASGGKRWRTSGYVLLILAGVIFFCLWVLGHPVDAWTPPLQLWAIGLPLAVIFAFSGARCLKHGKQIDVRSAQTILAQDLRAPVVYLRSFQDDRLTAQGSLDAGFVGGGAIPALIIHLLNRAGGVMSEEEQLGEALKEVGPFVAVGKRGEPFPHLGAARMYVQDNKWQDRVRELMDRAALIVLRAGKTEGVWWEIKTAIESARPQRVIILLPYDRRQYEIFRMKAEECLKFRLPDYPRRWLAGGGSIRGILYFEPDWRPRFQAVKFRLGALNLIPALKTTLLPVFEQLHVKVTMPTMRFRKVLLITLFSAIGALVVRVLGLLVLG